jgi:hypothetical protein
MNDQHYRLNVAEERIARTWPAARAPSSGALATAACCDGLAFPIVSDFTLPGDSNEEANLAVLL